MACPPANCKRCPVQQVSAMSWHYAGCPCYGSANLNCLSHLSPMKKRSRRSAVSGSTELAEVLTVLAWATMIKLTHHQNFRILDMTPSDTSRHPPAPDSYPGSKFPQS